MTGIRTQTELHVAQLRAPRGVKYAADLGCPDRLQPRDGENVLAVCESLLVSATLGCFHNETVTTENDNLTDNMRAMSIVHDS